MPDNVITLPSVPVSPELATKREELGILHDLLASMSETRIRAAEWERAKKALDYIARLVDLKQSEADALTPVVPTAPVVASPAIPDKAATA